jgi:hypothetical protein
MLIIAETPAGHVSNAPPGRPRCRVRCAGAKTESGIAFPWQFSAGQSQPTPPASSATSGSRRTALHGRSSCQARRWARGFSTSTTSRALGLHSPRLKAEECHGQRSDPVAAPCRGPHRARRDRGSWPGDGDPVQRRQSAVRGRHLLAGSGQGHHRASPDLQAEGDRSKIGSSLGSGSRSIATKACTTRVTGDIMVGSLSGRRRRNPRTPSANGMRRPVEEATVQCDIPAWPRPVSRFLKALV